ncbi:hypothetical protein IE81DRAFT_63825 [Ceraceosorus guamensis]|uniref:Uncharacterized protein n=1 Tax=Ceraceosorus guamensis TaxID=1522189 RepID=A0A316VNM4_9BASI|nr:hypothetical protein IE81DRAFT_63825 [Ceraceosorus guamensis]PWN38920.1 hypothetical protein IE81DRAFT_63825 [Ceraceosorus guamensis]
MRHLDPRSSILDLTHLRFSIRTYALTLGCFRKPRSARIDSRPCGRFVAVTSLPTPFASGLCAPLLSEAPNPRIFLVVIEWPEGCGMLSALLLLAPESHTQIVFLELLLRRSFNARLVHVITRRQQLASWNANWVYSRPHSLDAQPQETLIPHSLCERR